jgi:predicted HAD superfamily Cof-like phosphohydrolase
MDVINKVREFHKTFNHNINDEPTIVSQDEFDLRIKLLQEEIDELKEAYANKDLVEVGDALTDIQYILAGTYVSFGYGDKADEMFDDVQASNMSKACKTQEEVEASLEYYEEKGIDVYAEQVGDYYIIKRNGDNKILKNKFYTPADIKNILKLN